MTEKGKFADVDDKRGTSNSRERKNSPVRHKGRRKQGRSMPRVAGYNDVSWYAKNDNMLRDSASYSYNAPIGTAVVTNPMVAPVGEGTTVHQEFPATFVPGILTMHIGMGPGKSTDRNSPINLAANNIYSYVRYMNSGAKNYDATDLIMFCFAMDSAYSCWNFIKRIYGLGRLYSQQNWYLPKALLESMGVDAVDVMQHLADLRMYLNTTAAKLSSFCVPSTMPLFLRHSWMFANIYKDSDTDKAQLYCFVPEYFYVYKENESEKGGFLEATPWFPANWAGSNQYGRKTVADIMHYMDNIMNNLTWSEDIGIMSGDILKAYGQQKLFKVTPVEPDYEVIPVYNEEVLVQIHNAKVMATTFDSAYDMKNSWNIVQDPDRNVVVWNPVLNAKSVGSTQVFVNLPWANPTPANTMIATRLTACARYDETSKRGSIEYCGSEVVTRMFIYDLVVNGELRQFATTDMSFLTTPIATTTYSQMYSTLHELLRRMCLTSQFDWHPLMEVIISSEDQESPRTDMQYVGVMGDINTYTVLHFSDLYKLHLTAIMSELDIPQIGSF